MIFCFECSSNEDYKINEIDNKFSLGGDKFMLGIHLKQSGFTYSAFESFTESKERIQKFEETWDAKNIYKKSLIKLAFNMIWLMEIFKI